MDAGIAIVDSAFNPVAPDTLWTDQPKTPHGGRVEHIWTKSFTEFFIKRRRGSNGPTRDINLFVTWNSPSTLDNIDPVPPEILGRTQAQIERLLKSPTISAAQSAVETRFAEITAEIAADPELRAIFGAMPDPNA